jgi:hypothetical protein
MLLKRAGDPIVRGTLEGFFGAAAPEEAFKLLVLLAYCDRHREFDEPMDGIVYGSIASLGFATLENVLYVGRGGMGTAILRALTAVPGHAFWGAILGYYVGQAKFFPAHRWRLIATGYLLAVLLHGTYDMPLMVASGYKNPPGLVKALVLLTLGALVFSWVFVVRRVRRLRADQLHVVAVRALARGEAPPPGVLSSAPPTTGARIAGWLMILSGGGLASLGGLAVLTAVLTVVLIPDRVRDGANFAVGAAIAGLVPLALGLVLFASGLRRLRLQAPISPYAARSA